MKQTLIVFITLIFCTLQINAQISLKGVVTVQNSKTNTGKTEYVSNAQVECDKKAQPKTSDSKGEFTLEISGKQNEQIAIIVTPKGKYETYVVVNEKEIKDLTLGRVTPVNVYVCKKGELEQRQAEMVGINMQKLEERLDKEKQRLQKELNELKSRNDYLNARYREIKDSLNALDDIIDKAFEKIKEYAQIMALENLDDRDENYVKAYNCFLKGNLDSVSYYLRDDYLDKKYEKVLQLQKDAQKEKALAAALTESAKAKEEFSENSLNELIKEWLLLARTYDMKNDYEKATAYYEKAVNADTTNVNNIFEFAHYLHKMKEYTKAEKQYRKCLEIYWALERENPKKHLPDVAKTLNDLAVIHYDVNEYSKALKEYEETLEISKKLAVENPKAHLPEVAATLNNLGNLHLNLTEYPQALEGFEEALKIYKKLAEENPKVFLSDVAMTLNNLGNLHKSNKDYPKAFTAYDDALKTYRKLAEGEPKIYLPDVAMSLNNLGILHSTLKEYPKALAEFEESLKIRRKLAEENPKTYLPDVAKTLNSLGILHSSLKEYPKALAEFDETLNTYRKLVVENPNAYLPNMAMTLNNLGNLYKVINEYAKGVETYKEVLEIYKKLAEETPKVYVPNLITTLSKLSYTSSQLNDYHSAIKYTHTSIDYLLKYKTQMNAQPAIVENYSNLAWYYLFTKEYGKSEQYARQALELDSTSFAKTNLAHALLFQNRFSEAEKLYKELSKTIEKGNETYTQSLLDDFNALEEASVIPEKHKKDVEKIREMLKEK